MIHPIANAPCSWGVDDPKNPNLPAWATVLKEAAQAGYRSIELGPWGYLPTDPASLRAALEQHQLSLVAGTIFDDLVSEAHFPTLVALTHQICRNLSQVAAAEPIPGRPFQPPYLVIIDFGNPERARFAGRGALAPRLNDKDWQRMMEHIIALSTLAWQEVDRDRVAALLEQVELSSCADARPATLSGGMRQRAALARTLYEDRPIVLMDEPFSALDTLTRTRIQTLAATLLAGRTVVLITHDPQEACRLSHRLLVLSAADGDIDDSHHLAGTPPRAPDAPDLLIGQAALLQQLMRAQP